MILRCIWTKGKHGEPMEPILVGRSHLGENDTLQGAADMEGMGWTFQRGTYILNQRWDGVHSSSFSRSVFRFGRREGRLVECSVKGEGAAFFSFSFFFARQVTPILRGIDATRSRNRGIWHRIHKTSLWKAKYETFFYSDSLTERNYREPLRVVHWVPDNFLQRKSEEKKSIYVGFFL